MLGALMIVLAFIAGARWSELAKNSSPPFARYEMHVGADVHFVAGKGRRGIFGQLTPARAGDECEHDHERAEHSATNSFHGFRLPPPDDAPQAEMMGASMPAMLPQVIRGVPRQARDDGKIIRKVARNFLPRRRRGRRRCHGKYFARRFGCSPRSSDMPSAGANRICR